MTYINAQRTILLQSCYNFLKRGDDDTPTVQLHLAVVLQTVKHARDIQTAVAQTVGQTRHQDVERLGTGGVDGMVDDKTHEALAEGGCRLAPGLSASFLSDGRQHVQEVETDDEEMGAEAEHLVLLQGDEVAGAAGDARTAIAGSGAEEHLGLQQPRCRQLLNQAVGAVVAARGELQGATDKEQQLLTLVTLA